jgi:hypothetical protein
MGSLDLRLDRIEQKRFEAQVYIRHDYQRELRAARDTAWGGPGTPWPPPVYTPTLRDPAPPTVAQVEDRKASAFAYLRTGYDADVCSALNDCLGLADAAYRDLIRAEAQQTRLRVSRWIL